MKKTLPLVAAIALLFGFSSSASALTLDDPGVVGLLEGQTANNATVEAQIGTNILSLGEDAVVLASFFSSPDAGDINCDGGTNDQEPCEYRTGDNVYASQILSGGVQQTTDPTVLTPEALASEYILAKYDGPNAGYVLFNVADWLADGNTALPATGEGLANWGTQGISHYTYFGTRTVPDGGITISLLGSALVGLGLLRRRMNI
jgi:hypothetical protein